MIFYYKSEIYSRKQNYKSYTTNKVDKIPFIDLIYKFNNISLYVNNTNITNNLNVNFSKNKTSTIYSNIYINKNVQDYQNYEINNSLKNEILQSNYDILDENNSFYLVI